MTAGVLPGDVPPALARAMEHHSPEAALAFIEHVRGGTSTNVLADIFREAGTPVSATTIKKYRRSLDER